jgi:DUF438 domain-containing protein
MEVLNVVAGKRDLARMVLQDLISNYKRLDDTQRLEKANTILDGVNSYLQIEENLFFPFMRKSGEYEDLIQRLKVVHDQIDEAAEHAIMMHVDEPSGEFYHAVANLAKLLDVAKRNDEEILVPWSETYLSEEDQYFIATHLKNQMVQESLPSSGMTIY